MRSPWVLLLVLAACGTGSVKGLGDGRQDGDGHPNVTGDGDDSPFIPGGDDVAPDPTTVTPPDAEDPTPSDVTVEGLSPAPALTGVQYVPNRSSVRLYLPVVDGAKDYRVFAIEDGVVVSFDEDEREHVAGGTLHCAGWTQRNQCSETARLPITYNNEYLDMPACGNEAGRSPHVPTTVKRTLDVIGLKPNTTLVVEAIDRLCPFPGLFGVEHDDVRLGFGDISGVDRDGDGNYTANIVVNDQHYNVKAFEKTFPVRTEAEIRAQYGSMILNGQGPNLPSMDPSSPGFPKSPYIGSSQPAPVNDPKVLARAIIVVSPSGSSSLPDGFDEDDFFDDFEDDDDQPTLVQNPGTFFPAWVGYGDESRTKLFRTSKWNMYDLSNEFSQMFVNRGQLHTVMGDPAQNTMTVQAMYPRRVVHLPDASDRYLHVTYEVQHEETARRYENFTLCGSSTPGMTYADDKPRSPPIAMPGFMNDTDTKHTSPLGWNCLYLIPRGSGFEPLPGGDGPYHSDTTLRVTVVDEHPAPTSFESYYTPITEHAKSFGPNQDTPFPRQWGRQINAQKQMSGPLLDDQLNIWQHTKFDVFVRRDRVVIYVNGEARVCSNFADKPLTMAEGALGLWNVLYHTSAEFTEMRAGGYSGIPASGQHHIFNNTPFASQRSWDNIGIRENVQLPEGFDEARCL